MERLCPESRAFSSCRGLQQWHQPSGAIVLPAPPIPEPAWFAKLMARRCPPGVGFNTRSIRAHPEFRVPPQTVLSDSHHHVGSPASPSRNRILGGCYYHTTHRTREVSLPSREAVGCQPVVKSDNQGSHAGSTWRHHCASGGGAGLGGGCSFRDGRSSATK